MVSPLIHITADLAHAETLAEALAGYGCPSRVIPTVDSEAVAEGALVRALPAGNRRIPDELAVWVSRSPGRSLVLVCEEPLARPAISLHRGRILLLEASAPSAQHAEVIASWRVPAAASSLIQEQRSARWSLLIATDPAQNLVTRVPRIEAAVLIGPRLSSGQEAQIQASMQDPPTSRLPRLADQCGQAALIQLDLQAGEWLVVAPAWAPLQVAIGGRGRVPGAWLLHAGNGMSLNRRLRAYPGDVLLATWSLPMPVLATLAGPLASGAAAVLNDFFTDPGTGAAVCIEAR